MAPIDGLTFQHHIMILVIWVTTDGRQSAEGGSYSAKYSMGQFSVGYGETLHAPAQEWCWCDSYCSNTTL